MEYDRLVDVKGLCCAVPIARMKKEFGTMSSGQVALIVSDKVSMLGDVISFCNMTRHELVKQQEENGIFNFWLKVK